MNKSPYWPSGQPYPPSDPQQARLSRAHKAEGLWECNACESANDEDNETCWNCEGGRDV